MNHHNYTKPKSIPTLNFNVTLRSSSPPFLPYLPLSLLPPVIAKVTITRRIKWSTNINIFTCPSAAASSSSFSRAV